MPMELFEVDYDERTFVFVITSESFSLEDAMDYLRGRKDKTPKEASEQAPEQAPWQVPDDIQRQRMFLGDFRQMGVEFCANKYGCSVDEVKSEAARLNLMRNAARRV